MPHHVPTRATRQDTVLVFTDAENIAKAKQSGADIVGGMELIEPAGFYDFSHL
jgi:ribosomal protein L1